MPKTLDIRVSQALHRLRMVERALHEPGPWVMRYRGVEAPACRFVRKNMVSFVAHFPPLCHLEGEADQAEGHVVEVYCGGDFFYPITLPGPLDEDGAQVWWDLELAPEPDRVEV